ncbi:DUF5958 family protein [Bacteroides sp. 51]|uniref:DUF5958 family protein n=1 Tax=Bacteroides sp. 51 TaxID=2302938 RepID=UPI0013D83AE6|nr:DUF5958 family protein [Bacteroides sp. 51]NDV80439.1 hypothetical protein [Bacteroides sp. 51]
MEKIDELLINQYAQEVIAIELILKRFNELTLDEKREYLSLFIGYFIIQSKPFDSDIPKAIEESKLKPTYTPCIMIKKGVATHNLLTISKLPEDELNKVLRLFLSIFKIAYLRRYEEEKENTNKWWYWDLSDKNNVDKILNR